jgi:hypothetical protein
MVNAELNTRQFLPRDADVFAARKLHHAQAIQKTESDQTLTQSEGLARASQRLLQSFTIDPLGSPVDA